MPSKGMVSPLFTGTFLQVTTYEILCTGAVTSSQGLSSPILSTYHPDGVCLGSKPVRKPSFSVMSFFLVLLLVAPESVHIL
jgi:hypothetical protein